MKTSYLFMNLIVLIIVSISCSKNDGSSASKNVKFSNDTIPLNIESSCIIQYDNDTCFFQRIGDTLKIYGNILIICGNRREVLNEYGDTIQLQTVIKNPTCMLAQKACFDIKIPYATNYSVVKFNGKTYKGF